MGNGVVVYEMPLKTIAFSSDACLSFLWQRCRGGLEHQPPEGNHNQHDSGCDYFQKDTSLARISKFVQSHEAERADDEKRCDHHVIESTLARSQHREK